MLEAVDYSFMRGTSEAALSSVRIVAETESEYIIPKFFKLATNEGATPGMWVYRGESKLHPLAIRRASKKRRESGSKRLVHLDNHAPLVHVRTVVPVVAGRLQRALGNHRLPRGARKTVYHLDAPISASVTVPASAPSSIS